jgi:predicted  nucleic acid-binding Zn ribbon protein
MITNFKNFSGIIAVELNGEMLNFRLKYNENILPFEISLYLVDNKYADLSVIIPDSKKLSKKEFFMNPEIDTKIIKQLKIENFIAESGKESVAGENKTKSYILV